MVPSLRLVPAEPEIPAKPGGSPSSGRIRRARHYLLLPEGVEVEEVELLALSRFPLTRWEPAPHAHKDVLEPGVLRTSRHSVLVGPYARGEGVAGCLFDVIGPRERGEAAFEGTPDPDGVLSAFPAGLPIREEGRLVNWLVAAARRLGATLVLDDVHVVTPDPEAHIDLTVFSDIWLAPEAALVTIGKIDTRAVFAPSGQDWAGPPADIASRPLPEGVELSPELREAIHAAADDVDVAALTAEPAPSGYAIHVDLGIDGLIAVEIGGEEILPTSLQGLPWAGGGAVAYRLRWFAHDAEDQYGSSDGFEVSREHRITRSRAAQELAAIARALHEVTGGEIADQDDFLVNPEGL